MIPYLLAVAGGYILGNAFKDDMPSFDKGGEIDSKIETLEKALKSSALTESVKSKIKEKIKELKEEKRQIKTESLNAYLRKYEQDEEKFITEEYTYVIKATNPKIHGEKKILEQGNISGDYHNVDEILNEIQFKGQKYIPEGTPKYSSGLAYSLYRLNGDLKSAGTIRNLK